jgi:hypothetical protein
LDEVTNGLSDVALRALQPNSSPSPITRYCEEQKMTTVNAATEFKRKLCSFYGYDEAFHFVRPTESQPLAAEVKASLGPRDFLNFAIEDSVALEEERNRVNCLSNSKRAIDSQVDRLVHRLGFLPLARKERWNIPKKLEFITKIGIVAPRILRRLTALRNRLEHEFAPPSQEQVEDALDITTLFLSYAELVHVPSLNWSLADKATVRYDYESMVFHFFDNDPHFSKTDLSPVLSLAFGEEGFQDFYDFLVRIVPQMNKKTDLGEDI